jgi:signal transduction histidine kinase
LAESGIDFVREIDPGESAYARADEEKLVIALDNIVQNAMEAVQRKPDGERIVCLRIFRKEGCWIISVADSGDGIPSEARQRIFDPFFSTKEKGSGIGLALAKRFVESFGGALALETTPRDTTSRIPGRDGSESFAQSPLKGSPKSAAASTASRCGGAVFTITLKEDKKAPQA